VAGWGAKGDISTLVWSVTPLSSSSSEMLAMDRVGTETEHLPQFERSPQFVPPVLKLATAQFTTSHPYNFDQTLVDGFTL